MARLLMQGSAALFVVALVFSLTVAPNQAQGPGSVLKTPVGPMELPIEVEIELSPAGSLKQAALWKELYQLLKNPYAIDCPPDDPATAEERELLLHRDDPAPRRASA